MVPYCAAQHSVPPALVLSGAGTYTHRGAVGVQEEDGELRGAKGQLTTPWRDNTNRQGLREAMHGHGLWLCTEGQWVEWDPSVLTTLLKPSSNT